MASSIQITATLRRTGGIPVARRQDPDPGAEQAPISRAAGIEPGLRRSRYALDA